LLRSKNNEFANLTSQALAKPSQQKNELLFAKNVIFHSEQKHPIKLATTNKNQQKRQINLEYINEEIHGKIPVYSCSCGVKILIPPDLSEINKAIKNHVIEHKKLSGQILSEDDLTQEILSVIIEVINEA
jgi:hypothetical protein